MKILSKACKNKKAKINKKVLKKYITIALTVESAYFTVEFV